MDRTGQRWIALGVGVVAVGGLLAPAPAGALASSGSPTPVGVAAAPGAAAAAGALASSGALAPAGNPVPAAGAVTAGTTYYVDSRAGDDSAAGTSVTTAWKSLDPVNAADLKPGDAVRLKRGGSWTGTLTLSGRGTAAAPITVGTYGEGVSPKISGRDGNCVVITGSYVRVIGIRASRCMWSGFEVSGDRNVLDAVQADGNISGVHIMGAHNTVKDSVLTGNDRMSVNTRGGDDDSGAFGVLLNGDDNLITGNLITGSYAASHDYRADGAAVEVYNGDRNRVTHNIARNNETFVELGAQKGKTATGNVFAHNLVTSSRRRAAFLVTRGARHSVGPVKGTVAVHNTVRLPGRDTIGWSCHHGCSPAILKLRNNVIVVGGTAGFEDGKGADEAGSVYQGRRKFKLGPKSVMADPRFRSAGNMRPGPGSPVFGRGVKLGPSWYGGAALARDLSGRPLPANPAAGAYQQ
ncbi:hemolysin [Planobispora rosea]|uniref:Hemolysin n=2 Tax=Planobispora rosea TaxID=35762 RepID=A0A8J3S525_PLARO|nr:hemolysin [Planobispora rosea]GIH83698.1 hemolysin [Planobispora rosea]